ncbi:MAG TPA: YraN family protein [Candidatus Acidoferrales bacterium]|nr:YraN family protein [Candidatus Acidoferrales bacterium]
MPLLSRAIFGLVRLQCRRGLAGSRSDQTKKERARRRGIAGETYAYWYLRRHGYVFVARNYRVPEDKAEIDLIGYEGGVLAFVEVKTRSGTEDRPGLPEEAVTGEKRFCMERMARRFLAERRMPEVSWRFDIVAIENRAGHSPDLRLYKNAFGSAR